MSYNNSWYDLTVTGEDRLLALSLEDWNAEKRRIVDTHGKASWAFVNRIDYVRRTLWRAKQDSRPIVQDPPQLRFYRDIADEPWKYGDDAFETWNELDRDLPLYPGRWRVAAYWARREEEEILAPQRARFLDLLRRAQAEYEAKCKLALKLQALVRGRQVRKRLNTAATKIQALIRGHQLRCSVRYMDCAECLGHGATHCEVEGRHLCRACFDKLGWKHCYWCGYPFHVGSVGSKFPACSAECWVQMVEDEPEYDEDEAPCGGCGDACYVGDYGAYGVPGYWCSRACAYDLRGWR